MGAPRTGTRTDFPYPFTEEYNNVPADKTAKIGKIKFILASKIDTLSGQVFIPCLYTTVEEKMITQNPDETLQTASRTARPYERWILFSGLFDDRNIARYSCGG